jgi:hypothetical protein
MLLVGIDFLSCLGRFQIGLDAVNYLFDLNDMSRPKIILSLGLIQFTGVRQRRLYNASKGAILRFS